MSSAIANRSDSSGRFACSRHLSVHSEKGPETVSSPPIGRALDAPPVTNPAPHSTQNFAPAAFSELQTGHETPSSRTAIRVPHSTQNFAPAAFGELQAGHATRSSRTAIRVPHSTQNFVEPALRAPQSSKRKPNIK